MKKITISVFTWFLLTGAVLLNTNSKAASKIVTDTISSVRYPEKPADISPLLVGEKIPSVKLIAADGKLTDLNVRVAEKPTILLFYRGGWCPFCNKELAGIQSIQADLTKMGYQIIAISTDSPENLNKSIAKHNLGYTLLSDADLNVTKQFGLAFKAPANYENIITAGSGGKNVDKLLPVPSVFILDQKGAIKFEYINPDFTQRISSKLLKAVAQTLQEDEGK